MGTKSRRWRGAPEDFHTVPSMMLAGLSVAVHQELVVQVLQKQDLSQEPPLVVAPLLQTSSSISWRSVAAQNSI